MTHRRLAADRLGHRATPSAGASIGAPPTHPEISVVITVRDHEDQIGHQVRAIAAHLQSLGRTFEVVAVNDGCRDNSLSILELVAASEPWPARTPTPPHWPWLRVVRGNAAGRAFLRGAAEARGATLLLIAGGRQPSLAPLGWALSRLAAGREAVILRGRYIVARRLLALPIIVKATGPSLLFERIFERRAQDLGIDVVGSRPLARTPTNRLLAPLLRLLTA